MLFEPLLFRFFKKATPGGTPLPILSLPSELLPPLGPPLAQHGATTVQIHPLFTCFSPSRALGNLRFAKIKSQTRFGDNFAPETFRQTSAELEILSGAFGYSF